MREIDLVGRMGGEEFGVFMPGVAPSATSSVAERIRTAVGAVQFRRTASPGVFPSASEARPSNAMPLFSDLFRQADERLYQAKQQRPRRVEITRLQPENLAAVQ